MKQFWEEHVIDNKFLTGLASKQLSKSTHDSYPSHDHTDHKIHHYDDRAIEIPKEEAPFLSDSFVDSPKSGSDDDPLENIREIDAKKEKYTDPLEPTRNLTWDRLYTQSLFKVSNSDFHSINHPHESYAPNKTNVEKLSKLCPLRRNMCLKDRHWIVENDEYAFNFSNLTYILFGTGK